MRRVGGRAKRVAPESLEVERTPTETGSPLPEDPWVLWTGAPPPRTPRLSVYLAHPLPPTTLLSSSLSPPHVPRASILGGSDPRHTSAPGAGSVVAPCAPQLRGSPGPFFHPLRRLRLLSRDASVVRDIPQPLPDSSRTSARPLRGKPPRPTGACAARAPCRAVPLSGGRGACRAGDPRVPTADAVPQGPSPGLAARAEGSALRPAAPGPTGGGGGRRRRRTQPPPSTEAAACGESLPRPRGAAPTAADPLRSARPAPSGGKYPRLSPRPNPRPPLDGAHRSGGRASWEGRSAAAGPRGGCRELPAPLTPSTRESPPFARRLRFPALLRGPRPEPRAPTHYGPPQTLPCNAFQTLNPCLSRPLSTSPRAILQ